VPRAYTVEALIKAYATVGFSVSAAGSLQPDTDKIALYAKDAVKYQHAARQLKDGRWSSKLGKLEDITHDSPDALANAGYGGVVGYLERARK
jgi:hypothetical protein